MLTIVRPANQPRTGIRNWEIPKAKETRPTWKRDSRPIDTLPLRATAKQSADRKKLEQLLKESGLWDEASTLDSTALGKLLEEKKVGGEIAKEILSLATEQERTTVRLSKLREEGK